MAIHNSIHSELKTRSRRGLVSTAIVDKSAVVRVGLTHILQVAGFRVAFGGSRLEEVPERLFRSEANQLVIVSLDNDGTTLLPQLRALKERHDSVRIVVLGEDLHPEELLPILAAGVNCVLLRKELSSEALIKSLELVLIGETIFSSCLLDHSKRQLQWLAKMSTQTSADHIPSMAQLRDYNPPFLENEMSLQLSDRETTILFHLMRGASNKLIARELAVAEATIKVHVRAVLRKIRASNRTQAAMWAHNFLAPDSIHNIRYSGAVSTDKSLPEDQPMRILHSVRQATP